MRRRLKRLVQTVIVILVLVLLAGIGIAWWWVRQPWPRTAGTLHVAGLQAPVEVIRDEDGIPHIYAENLHDLFFAQGYVHAQDRLWQMDFQRRVGLGRLSEILGEATLETDIFLRTVGTNRSAHQDLRALNAETRAALEAYAGGVNAYIAGHRGRRLPLEYQILGVSPEPWAPVDTLAWVKMMQWDLNGRWEEELLRARMIEAVGAARAAEPLPGYVDGGPLVVPETAVAMVGAPDLTRVRRALERVNTPMSGASEGLGSNNWVVAPEKSATGRPILANDPHLRFGVPAIWYEMSLHAPGYTVAGATLPGIIGVVIGHNEHIAWGLTNLQADVQDLYVERINPENPTEYEVNGSYVPFDIVREEIRVKGQVQPEVVEVKVSRHGPLLTEELIDGLQMPVAFKWLAAAEPSTVANAVLSLNRARNWREFTDALRQWDSPAQNFVYADVAGNIGYYGAGTVPIRAAGDGSTPLPGWTDEYEWSGTIPFDELPHTFNPPAGFVATANNKPVGDEYPYLLSTSWSSPNRARRILAYLTTKDELSLDDMAAMQADIVSLLGKKLAPLLLAVESDDIITQRAQAELAAWDYRMNPDSVGAGIFEVAYWQLVQEIVRDELGEELTGAYLAQKSQHVMFVERLLDRPNDRWWDDTRTPARETRDEIVARVLAQTVEWWGRNYGDLVDKDWTWGTIHTTTFEHTVFGSVEPLDRLFNVEAGPTAGDTETPQANGFSFEEPFRTIAGPGYRQIVDVGAWENSRSMIIVGQSGHLFHPHYDDFTAAWRAVRYHPMRWGRDQIEGASRGATLRLVPPAD